MKVDWYISRDAPWGDQVVQQLYNVARTLDALSEVLQEVGQAVYDKVGGTAFTTNMEDQSRELILPDLKEQDDIDRTIKS